MLKKHPKLQVTSEYVCVMWDIYNKDARKKFNWLHLALHLIYMFIMCIMSICNEMEELLRINALN